ncbi:gluconokinase [Microbacterium sp.]|uniref:gluconokinase n=1 Tax=Microbacterium sp. TaxID=51671 RepID=UPI0037354DAF
MSATLPASSIVVMGVSAAGKSTIAAGLANALGCDFVDADDLHPAANVAKMAAGEALTDDDRWPWLDTVGRRLAASQDGVVMACSALRRAYRDRIRREAPDAVFIHLTASEELLARRAAARTGHFMPASLLTSQLALLEHLDDDEVGVVVDVDADVPTIVGAARDWVVRHAG